MSIESAMPSNHLIFCRSLLPWPQSSPASGSGPVSWLFTSGGQSTGASDSASVLPMNIQGLFPLGLAGLILLSKGLFKSPFQHNSKVSVPWCSAFFMIQLSHPYMTSGKSIALTVWTFVGKVMSLLFNKLSKFIIAFLPRSKCHSYSHHPQWFWSPPKENLSLFPLFPHLFVMK